MDNDDVEIKTLRLSEATARADTILEYIQGGCRGELALPGIEPKQSRSESHCFTLFFPIFGLTSTAEILSFYVLKRIRSVNPTILDSFLLEQRPVGTLFRSVPLDPKTYASEEGLSKQSLFQPDDAAMQELVAHAFYEEGLESGIADEMIQFMGWDKATQQGLKARIKDLAITKPSSSSSRIEFARIVENYGNYERFFQIYESENNGPAKCRIELDSEVNFFSEIAEEIQQRMDEPEAVHDLLFFALSTLSHLIHLQGLILLRDVAKYFDVLGMPIFFRRMSDRSGPNQGTLDAIIETEFERRRETDSYQYKSVVQHLCRKLFGPEPFNSYGEFVRTFHPIVRYL